MKTILLTGAQGGIGTAIAQILKQNGNNVIGVDRAEADLSSYEDIQKLEKRIAGEGTVLDWSVFAHGFIDSETDLQKQRPENIDATFQLNIVSIVYCAQLFLKHLRKGGGMVFLSSTAALSPNGRYAAYSASKAAVNAFAQALARNRPEQVFYTVCPGPTNTPMREKIADDASQSQPPSAVASVVADLISGKTDYKSGDIIVVRDGNVSKTGGPVTS